MNADAYRGALEAVERILNRGGDADDVLRAVVAVLHDRLATVSWVGISLLEAGELALGPAAGSPGAAPRTGVSIVYEGRTIGGLAIEGEADRAFLERVATLVSPYCLVAWDTGGVPWSELS